MEFRAKISLISLAIGIFFIASFALAQNGNESSTTQELLDTIIELREQINILQEKIADLEQKPIVSTTDVVFSVSMTIGSQGEAVKKLQNYLKQFPDLYPEGLVTGYFGPLTEEAVKRFQIKEAIVSTGNRNSTGFGRVGPKTLLSLNKHAKGNMKKSVSINPEIETETKDQQIMLDGIISNSTTSTSTSTTTPPISTTTPSATTPLEVTPTVEPSQNLPDTTSSSGSTSQATSTQSKLPIISNLQATNIAATSSTITWNTDITSTSEVQYSTQFPLTATSTAYGSNNVTNHVVDLTNLMASTTYYYMAVSNKDGWRATSSVKSFKTLSTSTPSYVTINSFTGPSALEINIIGSWLFSATSPNGSQIAFTMNWGDSTSSTATVDSGATHFFSHSYSTPATYPLILTAISESTLATATTSVLVTKPASPNPGGWSYTLGHRTDSSPAIATDGTIYIGAYDKNLYAFNPNGTLKWKFVTGAIVNSSPAVASDGTIYVGAGSGGGGGLYAINPDGTEKWKFTALLATNSSPAIASDGTIYIPSWDKNLYAINPDGTEKWKFSIATQNWSDGPPAIGSDGTIYVASGSPTNRLYAVNPDGTKKWIYVTDSSRCCNAGPNMSPAIGSDGTIYIGSSDRKLHAINPNGTSKWVSPVISNKEITSSPVIATDGTVYINTWGNFTAINPSDGSVKWIYPANNTSPSVPAVGSDGTIYVAMDTGYSGNSNVDYISSLFALNSDGTKKWEFELDNNGQTYSSPAIGSDGKIYIGTRGNVPGKLYAIESDSQGLANSVWPKFHKNNQNRGRMNDTVATLNSIQNNLASLIQIVDGLILRLKTLLVN